MVKVKAFLDALHEVLSPLLHTLGLNIFNTLMQLSWKELSQGKLKQKVAMKDIY